MAALMLLSFCLPLGYFADQDGEGYMWLWDDLESLNGVEIANQFLMLLGSLLVFGFAMSPDRRTRGKALVWVSSALTLAALAFPYAQAKLYDRELDPMHFSWIAIPIVAGTLLALSIASSAVLRSPPPRPRLGGLMVTCSVLFLGLLTVPLFVELLPGIWSFGIIELEKSEWAILWIGWVFAITFHAALTLVVGTMASQSRTANELLFALGLILAAAFPFVSLVANRFPADIDGYVSLAKEFGSQLAMHAGLAVGIVHWATRDPWADVE